MIDSQSIKSSHEGEQRSFHGGKKVNGRSRQIAVDTEGNVWVVHVHAANGADAVESCVLAEEPLGHVPTVQALCPDQGYRRTSCDYVQQEWERPVHITSSEGRGFELEPKRWVVERTFAWFNGQRR